MYLVHVAVKPDSYESANLVATAAATAPNWQALRREEELQHHVIQRLKPLDAVLREAVRVVRPPQSTIATDQWRVVVLMWIHVQCSYPGVPVPANRAGTGGFWPLLERPTS